MFLSIFIKKLFIYILFLYALFSSVSKLSAAISTFCHISANSTLDFPTSLCQLLAGLWPSSHFLSLFCPFSVLFSLTFSVLLLSFFRHTFNRIFSFSSLPFQSYFLSHFLSLFSPFSVLLSVPLLSLFCRTFCPIFLSLFFPFFFLSYFLSHRLVHFGFL